MITEFRKLGVLAKFTTTKPTHDRASRSAFLFVQAVGLHPLDGAARLRQKVGALRARALIDGCGSYIDTNGCIPWLSGRFLPVDGSMARLGRYT